MKTFGGPLIDLIKTVIVSNRIALREAMLGESSIIAASRPRSEICLDPERVCRRKLQNEDGERITPSPIPDY